MEIAGFNINLESIPAYLSNVNDEAKPYLNGAVSGTSALYESLKTTWSVLSKEQQIGVGIVGGVVFFVLVIGLIIQARLQSTAGSFTPVQQEALKKAGIKLDTKDVIFSDGKPVAFTKKGLEAIKTDGKNIANMLKIFSDEPKKEAKVSDATDAATKSSRKKKDD